MPNPKRTLLITDIHGSYKALLQVLERAKFDPASDTLISLGDVCDGWPDVTECIEFLSNLEHHRHVLGNHDDWCYRWLGYYLKESSYGLHFDEYRLWCEQGGGATVNSLGRHDSYRLIYDYLSRAEKYILLGNDLLVHGGLGKNTKLAEATQEHLMWDRTMIIDAIRASEGEVVREDYNDVYCGHTSTTLLKTYVQTTPLHKSNVWMLDTGASYAGKLSVLDYRTKEVWQSDVVTEIYPGIKAR